MPIESCSWSDKMCSSGMWSSVLEEQFLFSPFFGIHHRWDQLGQLNPNYAKSLLVFCAMRTDFSFTLKLNIVQEIIAFSASAATGRMWSRIQGKAEYFVITHTETRCASHNSIDTSFIHTNDLALVINRSWRICFNCLCNKKQKTAGDDWKVRETTWMDIRK